MPGRLLETFLWKIARLRHRSARRRAPIITVVDVGPYRRSKRQLVTPPKE